MPSWSSAGWLGWSGWLWARDGPDGHKPQLQGWRVSAFFWLSLGGEARRLSQGVQRREAMRDFLRTQVLVFSCYLGGMLGAVLSVATVSRWALQRYQVEHPGEYVCGLFALPYLFLGFVLGAIVGGLLYGRARKR
jgi:hypothetical protein